VLCTLLLLHFLKVSVGIAFFCYFHRQVLVCLTDAMVDLGVQGWQA
jgi:hypothetical protein